MAGPAGKKRQVSQTDIEPEESSMRTRSKATKENNGNRRTNRSSDQSNASSSTIVQHDKKRSSSQAPVKKKEPIVKNGIARVVKRTTNAKISKPSTVKETKRPRSSFSKVAISDGRSREDGNDVETIDEADAGTTDEDTEADNPHGPCYWLMKAEPNSRLEKGKDVKFSIDDLMKADKPEAWDGVRNGLARNNLRSMMKGDLAFFYHSNCKTPGIVGTMEVVGEHSVDETAFDKEHPYFDEKSTRENPKWCVVHVEFRNKFPEMVTLKELQRYAKPGGVLENMQVLKLSRLSVSQVSAKEWDFIHTLTHA